MPVQAEELTAIAVEVVERLNSETYASDTIELVRGIAWRERAQALQYTGRLDAAYAAIERAAAALELCPHAEVERGRTQLVRSIMLWRSEQLDAALTSARAASEVFQKFNLSERTRAARWMEAILLDAKNDFRGALDMFRQIESEMTNARPADVATIMANIGVCYREMGNYERALPQYEIALSIHEEAGNGPEAVRTRWNIAETLAAAGKIVEAEKRFRSVRMGFESRHGSRRRPC